MCFLDTFYCIGPPPTPTLPTCATIAKRARIHLGKKKQKKKQSPQWERLPLPRRLSLAQNRAPTTRLSGGDKVGRGGQGSPGGAVKLNTDESERRPRILSSLSFIQPGGQCGGVGGGGGANMESLASLLMPPVC